jgi:cellulose synthase/poly-beta-1,6-N-acetylglucosamine synthase-like glycosyltransferase
VSVEVAVFCRNEEARIRGALEVLRAQADSLDERFLPLRVIVLDNGSTDRSAAVAAAAARELSLVGRIEIQVEEGLPPGKARAWNAFIARATTEMLVFVDADVDLAAGALQRLLQHLAQEPGLVLAGAVRRLPPGHVPRGFWQQAFSIPYRDLRRPESIAGVAYAARRRSLRPLPVDSVNEDLALSLRHAGSYAIVDEAVAYVEPPADLATFLRQRTRVLRGDRLEARRGAVPLAAHRRRSLADLVAFGRAGGPAKLVAFLGACAIAEVQARLARGPVAGWTD